MRVAASNVAVNCRRDDTAARAGRCVLPAAPKRTALALEAHERAQLVFLLCEVLA